MAVRAPSVKRYVVRLSAEERGELEAMIRKGKSSAVRLLLRCNNCKDASAVIVG